jgi:ribonuclease R
MTLNQIYDQIYQSPNFTIEDDGTLSALVLESPYLRQKFKEISLKPGFLIGTMDLKKDFGFLRQPLEDVYVDRKDLMSAMQDDLVILDDRGHRPQVVYIVKRALERLICKVTLKQQTMYVTPETPIHQVLHVEKKQDVSDGDMVVVEVISITEHEIHGRITEILGHHLDPNIELIKLIAYHRWPIHFSDEVIQELNTLESDIQDDIDFKDALIITIDGIDAKDLDDAIHLKKLKEGYELGVHIADVSSYVKPNTFIDQAAYERATSVYMGQYVIPMLPEILSNGVCSLRPSEKKRVISLVMTLDILGNVTHYHIQKSVIMSSYRLNYDDVNRHLKGEKVYEDQALRHMLDHLNTLSKTLQKARTIRGEMAFITQELKFTFKNERAVDVHTRTTDDAEQLIESMMLLANETIAKHMFDHNIESIYRIHDVPDAFKMRDAMHILKNFGVQFPKGNPTSFETIQTLLKRVMDHPHRDLIHSIILRSMQKAIYHEELKGHFGLGATYYTHFTSPIRRYPDLLIHRLLHMYVIKDQKVKPLELEVMAKHTSDQERLAMTLERDAEKLFACQYLSQYPFKKDKGMIVHTMPKGVFIKMSQGIEGFASFQNSKHMLKYDSKTMSYFDRRGLVYKLGDIVDVEVIGVSETTRKIDLMIIRNAQKRR